MPVHRVIFHEVTPKAVMGGLNSPRPLDTDLVEVRGREGGREGETIHMSSFLIWVYLLKLLLILSSSPLHTTPTK